MYDGLLHGIQVTQSREGFRAKSLELDLGA